MHLPKSDLVFVLATLLSVFYSQIQQLPAFVDLKEADGQFDLLPAQPAEITQMIRQPALAAGLRFDKNPQTHDGLYEVLADEVKAEPRLPGQSVQIAETGALSRASRCGNHRRWTVLRIIVSAMKN
jgi:hypothetical protein